MESDILVASFYCKTVIFTSILLNTLKAQCFFGSSKINACCRLFGFQQKTLEVQEKSGTIVCWLLKPHSMGAQIYADETLLLHKFEK